jgi:hypothetical protein
VLVTVYRYQLPVTVMHMYRLCLRTFSNITLRRSRVTAFIAGLVHKSERVRKGAKVNLEHTSRARDRCIRYRYERVRLCSGIDNCPSCEFGCSLREEIGLTLAAWDRLVEVFPQRKRKCAAIHKCNTRSNSYDPSGRRVHFSRSCDRLSFD